MRDVIASQLSIAIICYNLLNIKSSLIFILLICSCNDICFAVGSVIVSWIVFWIGPIFFNFENMKHIINNNNFMQLEDKDYEDAIEEEVIEVRDIKLEWNK